MIDLNEQSYCLGLWYVQGNGADWLCAVYRQGGAPYLIRCRFRYYRDAKFHDSNDEKRWLDASPKPGSSEDQIIAVVDGLVADLVRGGFAVEDPWRRIIRGNSQAAMEALRSAPFTSIREQPPGDN